MSDEADVLTRAREVIQQAASDAAGEGDKARDVAFSFASGYLLALADSAQVTADECLALRDELSRAFGGPSLRRMIERARAFFDRRDQSETLERLEPASVGTVEQSQHEIVEKCRYVLEAGAVVLELSDGHRAKELKVLAHHLPYLLNGRRHWNDLTDFAGAGAAWSEAKGLAEIYGGFTLPEDPIEAVKAMLDLASMLFMPAWSVPVEALQKRFPLDHDRIAKRKDALGL